MLDMVELCEIEGSERREKIKVEGKVVKVD